MTISVILPWFPIVLSAAIGARLAGPRRAGWLGAVCALFWALVVQLTTGVPLWYDAVTASVVLAGSAAILGMAEWCGRPGEETAGGTAVSGNARESSGRRGLAENTSLDEDSEESRRRAGDQTEEGVSWAMKQFDDWLESNRFHIDPWPGFDEFIRHVLHVTCNAAHVRPYRILASGELLLPLRGAGAGSGRSTSDHYNDIYGSDYVGLSARTGILGYTATTGHSYYGDGGDHDHLIDKLTANGSGSEASRAESHSQWSPPARLRMGDSMKPVWCFAVRNSSQLIGVVSVGSFDSEDDRHRQGGTPWGSALDVSPHGSTPPTRARSRAMELAVSQFWMTLAEVCRGRRASVTDPVSRLLTREAFLDEAQMAAEGCYARGEPVAVAVIAVEGLRGLMDEGQWELANEVIAEVCRSLKARVRPDDLLGRFDDSRFCVLLRRVDSELASLIVTQLADRLSELSGTELFPSDDVCIRCGVAGSGHKSPQVGELLSGAVRICHRARMQEVRVAMDVDVVSARVAHAEEGDIETT